MRKVEKKRVQSCSFGVFPRKGAPDKWCGSVSTELNFNFRANRGATAQMVQILARLAKPSAMVPRERRLAIKLG